jgi:hypothetical protein
MSIIYDARSQVNHLAREWRARRAIPEPKGKEWRDFTIWLVADLTHPKPEG